MTPHPRQAEIDEVRRLHELGHSAVAIGKMTGTPYATAYAWIGRGFEVRPEGRPRLDPGVKRARARERQRERRRRERTPGERRRRRLRRRRERIRALWSEGWTGPELARRFRVDLARISEAVRGLGRPTRLAGRPELASPHPRRRFAPPPVPTPALPCRAAPDAADRLDGGFGHGRKGEAHSRAKLDDAAVLEMRRLRSLGRSVGELAKQFGVSGNTAGYAIQGVTWSHLPNAVPKGGRS